MKNFFHACIFLIFSLSSFGQASNTWSVKFSEAIRTRWTTAPVGGRVCIDKMTSKGWEYSNSIVLHGMEKVYKQVNDANYLNYIKAYVDNYVNTDGTFKAGVTLVSLDRIHPGILLLFLYQETGLAQYQTAATTLKNVLVGAGASYAGFRTPVNKIFWHKQSGYDNVMMLDGMYMAHPFLAKYGKMFGSTAAIDTAINQTLFAYNQLYVSANKLIKHAWKEPGTPGVPATWTPDGAGNSPSIWSRAMGWYMMALVDILKCVPAGHAKRPQLIAALDNLAAGIKASQDPASHLWYQVVNKNSVSLAGNYLETSGSAMFVYALKTACDSNWISSATYLQTAKDGWDGLKTNSIDLWPTDGLARINNFAPAMSALNSDALYAGTASVDCPGSAHPHGYAAILMAASVMEFPLVTLPVKFTSFTAKEYPSKTTLSWQMGDEDDAVHYEIQRSVNGTNFIAIGKVAAAGLSAYSFDDNTVENKTVYYRINAVYSNGSPHYSVTLSVRRNSHAQIFVISPNPVKGGDMNIITTNFKPGAYKINIISATGNVVHKATLNITEGISGQHIQIPTSIPKGIYYVQLTGEGIVAKKNIAIE
ncbi:MAG: glycoside hydrolase family 88 protein [Chitinophagales bacterium]